MIPFTLLFDVSSFGLTKATLIFMRGQRAFFIRLLIAIYNIFFARLQTSSSFASIK
jgi:hypothetical protein